MRSPEINIKQKIDFNEMITDNFIKVNNVNYNKIKHPIGNKFRLISYIFKTSSNIEYCLDISYAFLNRDSQLIYCVRLKDMFNDEYYNKKCSSLVYDINLNFNEYIKTGNNVEHIITDDEKSEIMSHLDVCINEYIKEYPDRKIFGLNLSGNEDQIEFYGKAFRKIFPNYFFKYNLNKSILFMHESMLLDNFKVEY